MDKYFFGCFPVEKKKRKKKYRYMYCGYFPVAGK